MSGDWDEKSPNLVIFQGMLDVWDSPLVSVHFAGSDKNTLTRIQIDLMPTSFVALEYLTIGLQLLVEKSR